VLLGFRVGLASSYKIPSW